MKAVHVPVNPALVKYDPPCPPGWYQDTDVNLRSKLVPDDVFTGGKAVEQSFGAPVVRQPENPSSKAVELVEVPSYIHSLSLLGYVSKAENETVTDCDCATTIAR